MLSTRQHGGVVLYPFPTATTRRRTAAAATSAARTSGGGAAVGTAAPVWAAPVALLALLIFVVFVGRLAAGRGSTPADKWIAAMLGGLVILWLTSGTTLSLFVQGAADMQAVIQSVTQGGGTSHAG